MQYTETDLQKLVADVEKEFTAHLAKAEEDYKASLAKSEGATESLAKAEDGKEKKAPEESKEAKPEGKPEGEAPMAAEGTSESKPAPEAGAKPAEAAGEDHCDYDDEDREHMHKMYMSMSKGELKAHHDSCRAALDSKGMEKCGEMSPSAPTGPEGKQAPDSHSHPDVQKSELNAHSENAPAPKDKAKAMNDDKANGGAEGCAPKNALGAKSPASDANGAKINKSEHDRRNGGKIEGQEPGKTPGAKSPASKAEGVQMEKSETGSEVELLKSQFEAEKVKTENLQKSLDAVSAFLTKLVEKRVAPQGKAITSLDVIAKSENEKEEKALTKVEIDSVLNKKAADPSLKKSDRDAINAFYLDNAGIESIRHLLK